jgi:hypothetical protein
MFASNGRGTGYEMNDGRAGSEMSPVPLSRDTRDTSLLCAVYTWFRPRQRSGDIEPHVGSSLGTSAYFFTLFFFLHINTIYEVLVIDMNKFIISYAMSSYIYCASRNAVYAPKLKKHEYMTDRIGTHLFLMGLAPIATPAWIYSDVKNLEHVIRKMPGPIDKWPW